MIVRDCVSPHHLQPPPSPHRTKTQRSSTRRYSNEREQQHILTLLLSEGIVKSTPITRLAVSPPIWRWSMAMK